MKKIYEQISHHLLRIFPDTQITLWTVIKNGNKMQLSPLFDTVSTNIKDIDITVSTLLKKECEENKMILSALVDANSYIIDREFINCETKINNLLIPIKRESVIIALIQVQSKTNLKFGLSHIEEITKYSSALIHSLRIDYKDHVELPKIKRLEKQIEISKNNNKNIFNFVNKIIPETELLLNRLESLKIIQNINESCKDREKYYVFFAEKHAENIKSINYLTAALNSIKSFCNNELNEVAKKISDMLGIDINIKELNSFDEYVQNIRDLIRVNYDEEILVNERVRIYRHQIKTMLNSINTDFLYEELQEEKEMNQIMLSNNDIMEHLNISIERAKKLLTQSHYIVSLSKGQQQRRLKNLSLTSLAKIENLLKNYTVSLKRFSLENRVVPIQFEYSLTNIYKSYYDINMIEEVIQILIENAAEELWIKNKKSSFNPMIFVKLFMNNGFLNISVKDNGRGIPKSIQKKIFEKYFTSGKTQGCGIGLAVVAKNIQENQGLLNLNSSSEGTEFQLKIKV